jgi:hypothetical protein
MQFMRLANHPLKKRVRCVKGSTGSPRWQAIRHRLLYLPSFVGNRSKTGNLRTPPLARYNEAMQAVPLFWLSSYGRSSLFEPVVF